MLLANAEANGMTKLTEQVRLDELLWDIKEEFNAQDGVQLQMQFSELPADEARLCITGNKPLLTLAVKNIILNAIKFSKGQPVLCSLHFTGHTATIRITDHGIGMEQNDLKNIFEPFFRSLSAIEYPGHGVGLYITKKIIDLLGGQIEVTSEPGQGSIFNIIFKQKNSF